MAVTNAAPVACSNNDYEIESICSTIDEYYLDRLFFGVEFVDISILNGHYRLKKSKLLINVLAYLDILVLYNIF